MTIPLNLRQVESTFSCDSEEVVQETFSIIDTKLIEKLKKQKHKDEINQRKLNFVQRNYVKCAKGKCPALMSEHGKGFNKLFSKRRKVNYLNVKKHDEKLAKIFVDIGRKKRIEILRAEVHELDMKLKVATGKMHTKEIDDNYKEIERNLKLQEDMTEKMKKAKTEIGHIKSQMERIDRKSIELDHETEAEVPFFEHFKRANRQLEIHENRLQISRQREGKMTAENKQLRELLCKMLYFRSIFNKHWNEIVGKLKNRKKFLLDMIERSSTAFSQDADLMDNYKKLLSRRNQDKESSIAEMLKMKREIDANDIMNMFLGQKGKYRPFAPLDKREVARRNNVKNAYDDRLNFYQRVIDEIKKYPLDSKDNSFEKSLDYFRFVDNECYEYYRYRDDINRRIDTLEMLTKLKSKEFNQNFSSYEKIQEHCLEMIKQQEQTLQEEVNKTITCKMENDKLAREVEKYSNAIFKIMKTLRCDLKPVQKLLQNQNDLDEHNLHIYLSIIEERVNQIIAFLYCKERENVDIQTQNNKFIVRSLKHHQPPIARINDLITIQQCPECAQTEDVNLDEVGDFVTMLTEDELRDAVIKKAKMPGLQRRMHTLSKCNLPRSGIIASRRYAE